MADPALFKGRAISEQQLLGFNGYRFSTRRFTDANVVDDEGDRQPATTTTGEDGEETKENVVPPTLLQSLDDTGAISQPDDFLRHLQGREDGDEGMSEEGSFSPTSSLPSFPVATPLYPFPPSLVPPPSSSSSSSSVLPPSPSSSSVVSGYFCVLEDVPQGGRCDSPFRFCATGCSECVGGHCRDATAAREVGLIGAGGRQGGGYDCFDSCCDKVRRGRRALVT